MTHDDEPARRDRPMTEPIADLSARLRRACADMPDDDFSALVQDVARMAVRLREIDEDPTLWRPATSKGAPVAPLPDRR